MSKRFRELAPARTIAAMSSFYDDASSPYHLGLAGLVAGRPDITWDDRGFLGTSAPADGVGVISGGGSGHEPLHAGFLVNDENGTAADYLALIAAVLKAVQEDSGVWLEPEVRIIR